MLMSVDSKVVSPAKPAVPTRSFWQRHVSDPILSQLKQGVTPDKIALTLAIGSALALFPIIGTTALLCLLVGIILQLNQPIIQAVNLLFTPLHIPFIIYCIYLGEKLFGGHYVKFNLHEFSRLLWDDPALFAQRFGLIGLHACIIWAIAAPFWIALIYYTSRTTLREMARVRALTLAKMVAPIVVDPTDHPIP